MRVCPGLYVHHVAGLEHVQERLALIGLAPARANSTGSPDKVHTRCSRLRPRSRAKPWESRKRFEDSVLNAALVTDCPTDSGKTSVEFAINPAMIREAFAADLPAETTALMAATQRPVAQAAFSDSSGAPAWRRLPSWAVVATGDKAAGTNVVRSMAQRAGAERSVETPPVCVNHAGRHLAGRALQG